MMLSISRLGTTPVAFFLCTAQLVILLWPREAASMCQCGIFVLWENNRVGEEVLLGDPMQGRCRGPQAASGRLEERCKNYCSTRSELLTAGGNLAVMGTFLSMATKFYACQMLHSLHQDPNGYHTHLGQQRIQAFWVGSFYRYCQMDWKFSGAESIKQVCCERSDFLICPANVDSNVPSFKLPDPPTTLAPETPAPASSQEAASKEVSAQEPRTVEPPKPSPSTEAPSPAAAPSATQPSAEAPPAPADASSSTVTPAQTALTQLFSNANKNAQASPASPGPVPGSQPTSGRFQAPLRPGLAPAGVSPPVAGVGVRRPSTAKKEPSNSPVPVETASSAEQPVGAQSPVPAAVGQQVQSPQPAVRDQNRKPTDSFRSIPTPGNSGEARPTYPQQVPQPQRVKKPAAGSRKPAVKHPAGPGRQPPKRPPPQSASQHQSQFFNAINQFNKGTFSALSHGWTPITSSGDDVGASYEYEAEEVPSYQQHGRYPPAKEHPHAHQHDGEYHTYVYPAYPPFTKVQQQQLNHQLKHHQQYFASRMDSAGIPEGEKPITQLHPDSGLEIHSSSLLDELNINSNEVMNGIEGDDSHLLGAWASDKFDPSVLDKGETMKPAAEDSRLLIGPPSRPRPTFPFRPTSHNSSSIPYVDFTLGLADAILAEMGVPTVGRIMQEMDYSRVDLITDIARMDRMKEFVQHEVNLGYCYAEYMFFDLFKNRHSYGFTFFGLPGAGRRQNDVGSEDDPHKDSFFLAFWRFLGRMRREGVAAPIVSFLRAAVRDITAGARRLIWGRRRRRRRRRRRNNDWAGRTKREADPTRSSRHIHHNPNFLKVLGRTLASVLTDAVTRTARHRRHSASGEQHGTASRDALSSNLRPFAVGPLSTFLDYMLESNSPDSGLYCLKNYVSSKMYFWLGKGLKSFLFT